MAFRKRTFKKRRGTKRKTVRKAIRRAKKAPLRRMIRAEIHRQVENKTVQLYPIDTVSAGLSFTYVTPGSTAGTAMDGRIIPLTPGHDNTLGNLNPYIIPQGTGQGQRVGNTITARRLMFKGVITSEPYNAGTNPNPYPNYVKMVLFYNKEQPSLCPTPQTDADMFQYGNTTDGWDGVSSDVIKTFNTDKYRILAVRTFKMGYSSVAVSGTIAAQEYFANNDFKLSQPFAIDCTKMIPKVMKFTDGSQFPSTRGLFALFYSCPAYGSAITGVSPSPQCIVRWEITFEYEDA